MRALVILIFLYFIASLLTLVANVLAAAPFVLWFNDTHILMSFILIYIGLLGLLWDGSLIATGLAAETWQHNKPADQPRTLTVAATRGIRFFRQQFYLPLLMLLVTSYIILGTSNITLLNIKLLGSITEWRDPVIWAIEAPAIKWMIDFPINVRNWDLLYHSAWSIELFAAFVLIVIDRHAKIVFRYCLSMILLFYVGRFLGVLNPVMGPAFFQPELFGYLDGSVTDTAMQLVSNVLDKTPDQAMQYGGILLGGVSAMPSLHLGMVSLAAHWLAIAKRQTLFITIPWVLLVWISTVVLGWHYILDGAGGIILATLCIWLTNRIFTLPWLSEFREIPTQHPSRTDGFNTATNHAEL